MIKRAVFLLLTIYSFSVLGETCPAMETVRAKIDGKETTLIGRLLASAGENGDIALQTRDGQVFILAREDILEESRDDTEFKPYTLDELKPILRKEFHAGFNILQTKHYLIVYDTSDNYAKIVGELFERLIKSYFEVWKKKFDLKAPEFPLVAVVFEQRDHFANYAQKQIGSEVPESLRAFYHRHTNRIVLYDVGQGDFNVASIIHEATHQVGFNCEMHGRFSPYPLWLCEGLAMLFEAPSSNQQKGIRMNYNRLATLRQYLKNASGKPLEALIKDDSLLLKGRSDDVLNNYAISWGMTYFLLSTRGEAFKKYMKKMSEKEDFAAYSEEERIKEFEEAFGKNWAKTYRDMSIFIQRIR